MILNKNNINFIHIPKNAGSSIEEYFFKLNNKKPFFNKFIDIFKKIF